MRCLDAEVLVAGAGPAGLTIARLLARKGRRVTVIDPGVNRPTRLELLAPGALGTVAMLGLMPLLDDPSVARPCLGIRRRWFSAVPVYEDFLMHPRRTGYVVDRANFDRSLRAAARDAGVDFVTARISGLDARGVRITATNGRVRRLAFAGTLVDASGRAAVVARRRGARIELRDRRVADLLENISAADVRSSPAWLDVARDDASSWSYRIEGAEGVVQRWRIGRPGIDKGNAIHRVDASATMLSHAAGEGWMAIGDAACAFDPIASQGLANALSSALAAAGALIKDAGLTPATARYYSDAVAATFLSSEIGRAQAYADPEKAGRATNSLSSRA